MADDPARNRLLGLATYSLVIRLPEEGGPYSIRTGRTYTASKVFLDGVPVTGSGKLADEHQEGVPSLEPRVVELPPGTTETELRVWVSNFHSHQGGLPWSWSIGPADDVVRATVRAAVVSGVLTAFMGVMSVLSC